MMAQSSDPTHRIVMGLLPPGSRPSIVDLRSEFSRALDRAVDDSIARYREATLPDDLRRLREQCDQRARELDDRTAALEKEQAHFRKLLRGQVRLMTAVEKWIEWMDGEGHTDELKPRFEAVRKAWQEFKSLKGVA